MIALSHEYPPISRQMSTDARIEDDLCRAGISGALLADGWVAFYCGAAIS
jgi:hypothetical protein